MVTQLLDEGQQPIAWVNGHMFMTFNGICQWDVYSASHPMNQNQFTYYDKHSAQHMYCPQANSPYAWPQCMLCIYKWLFLRV